MRWHEGSSWRQQLVVENGIAPSFPNMLTSKGNMAQGLQTLGLVALNRRQKTFNLEIKVVIDLQSMRYPN